MEYTPSFRDRLYTDDVPSFSHAITEDKKYGIPELKKFPMPDAAHVRSAIKFFNYVTPAHEQQLASAILARMDEYGISADSLNVGDENRFKKYLQHDSLMHHGIKGQKWGIRRYQNPDGTLTDAGRKRQQKQEYKAAKKALKTADKYGKLTVSNIDDPNYKNRKSVQKKMIKELDQSKEVKDYLDYDQKLYNLVKEAADRQGIPMNQIRLSSKDPAVAELIKRQEAATNKGRQIADKYIDEFSKALLRDIHAEDTEGGRMYVKEFLNKNGYQELLV